MDTIEERLPPHSIEAEEAVLGSLLIDPDALFEVSNFLRADAFYRAQNRWIYESMLGLSENRVPLDVVTLIEELRRRERLEEIGGESTVISLLNAVPTSINVEAYGKMVEAASIRRKLLLAAGSIAKLAYNEAEDINVVLDRSEHTLFSISEQRTTRDLQPVREIAGAYLERMELLRERGDEFIGIPTGFTDLDRMLSGLNKSDLVIVAARPGMGKTALEISIALNAARRYDKRVAMFNLEMSGEQLLQRMIAAETRIDSQQLRRGELADHEWAIFLEALGRLSETRIYIDDTPSISPMQLRTKCRRLYAEHGLDLVMIDYLQLMQAEHPSNNRVQEVSEISRELKGLARELDVPVVAAAQLSRAVESRQNKRPQLSDLRDSGCLTGDTLVTLADSGQRVAMRELAGRGDFAVWALNPITYQIERATATRAFSTGVKQTYRLTTRLGRTIRATGNHLFLTVKGWQRLDELTVGVHVALPRSISPGQTNSLSTAELALLGHLIGDGCALPRHAIQYTTKELPLAEMVASLTVAVFGDEVCPRIKAERTWYQVYLASTQHLTHGKRNSVSAWLDQLGVWGLRSHEKRVPEQVFEQNATGIATFLRHLWSTDGCMRMTWGKSPRPAIYFATSSARLASDVQSLLLRLEITANTKRISQGDKGRPQYHVIVTGRDDVLCFADRIGATTATRDEHLREIIAYLAGRDGNTNRDIIPQAVWDLHVRPAMREASVSHRTLYAEIGTAYGGMTLLKQNLSRERASRVAEATGCAELQTLAVSDVYWDQIASIEPDAVEEVFDLTVPGPHNFIANDIVVHNSIEQDADVVMFIYRDDYYNPDNSERPNIAEINVAKHRNGPTGSIDLFWHGKLATFRNLHRQEIEL